MFINYTNKMSTELNWWGTLYAAYSSIETMASFIYPLKNAVYDALWNHFWGQCMFIKISHLIKTCIFNTFSIMAHFT